DGDAADVALDDDDLDHPGVEILHRDIAEGQRITPTLVEIGYLARQHDELAYGDVLVGIRREEGRDLFERNRLGTMDAETLGMDDRGKDFLDLWGNRPLLFHRHRRIGRNRRRIGLGQRVYRIFDGNCRRRGRQAETQADKYMFRAEHWLNKRLYLFIVVIKNHTQKKSRRMTRPGFFD